MCSSSYQTDHKIKHFSKTTLFFASMFNILSRSRHRLCIIIDLILIVSSIDSSIHTRFQINSLYLLYSA